MPSLATAPLKALDKTAQDDAKAQPGTAAPLDDRAKAKPAAKAEPAPTGAPAPKKTPDDVGKPSVSSQAGAGTAADPVTVKADGLTSGVRLKSGKVYNVRFPRPDAKAGTLTLTVQLVTGKGKTVLGGGSALDPAGARVILRGPVTREAESDASGTLSFRSLPEGSYQVEATKTAGGTSVQGSAELRLPTTEPVQVRLLAKLGDASGTAGAGAATVLASPGSATVTFKSRPGVEIILRGQNGSEDHPGKTGVDGLLELRSSLQPGSYQVIGRKSGLAQTSNVQLTIPVRSTTTVDVPMCESFTLQIKAAQGAEIRVVHKATGKETVLGVTGNDMVLLCAPELPAGSYSIRAHKPGHVLKSHVGFDWKPGPNTSTEVFLQPDPRAAPGAVRLRVVRYPGGPVVSNQSYSVVSRVAPRQELTTDAQGEAQVTLAPDSHYELQPAGVPLPKLTKGADTLEVALASVAPVLTLRVTDRAGKGLAGVELTLGTGQAAKVLGTTGADGGLTATPQLAEASHPLQASLEGWRMAEEVSVAWKWQDTKRTLTLERTPRPVNLMLRYYPGGPAAKNHSFELNGGAERLSLQTDAEGNVEVSLIPRTRYTLQPGGRLVEVGAEQSSAPHEVTLADKAPVVTVLINDRWGRPVERAGVVHAGGTVRTDGSGGARIQLVAPGPLQAELLPPEGEDWVGEAEKLELAIEFRVQTLPAYGTQWAQRRGLRVTLRDAAAKDPIDGAEVTLTGPEHAAGTKMTSDAQGQVSFEKLAPGNYEVTASKGELKHLETLSVKLGEADATADGRLGDPARAARNEGIVRLRVVSDKQDPVANAQVDLILPDGSTRQEVTGSDGKLDLELPVGGTRVKVRKAGNPGGVDEEVTLVAGEVRELSLTLTLTAGTSGGTIKVRVVRDLRGTPAAGVDVELTERKVSTGKVKTGADGIAVFENTAVARWTAIAQQGEAFDSLKLDFDGSDLEVKLYLIPAHILREHIRLSHTVKLPDGSTVTMKDGAKQLVARGAPLEITTVATVEGLPERVRETLTLRQVSHGFKEDDDRPIRNTKAVARLTTGSMVEAAVKVHCGMWRSTSFTETLMFNQNAEVRVRFQIADWTVDAKKGDDLPMGTAERPHVLELKPERRSADGTILKTIPKTGGLDNAVLQLKQGLLMPPPVGSPAVLTSADGKTRIDGRTDKNGNVTFHGVPAGELQCVLAPGTIDLGVALKVDRALVEKELDNKGEKLSFGFVSSSDSPDRQLNLMINETRTPEQGDFDIEVTVKPKPGGIAIRPGLRGQMTVKRGATIIDRVELALCYQRDWYANELLERYVEVDAKIEQAALLVDGQLGYMKTACDHYKKTTSTAHGAVKARQAGVAAANKSMVDLLLGAVASVSGDLMKEAIKGTMKNEYIEGFTTALTMDMLKAFGGLPEVAPDAATRSKFGSVKFNWVSLAETPLSEAQNKAARCFNSIRAEMATSFAKMVSVLNNEGADLLLPFLQTAPAKVWSKLHTKLDKEIEGLTSKYVDRENRQISDFRPYETEIWKFLLKRITPVDDRGRLNDLTDTDDWEKTDLMSVLVEEEFAFLKVIFDHLKAQGIPATTVMPRGNVVVRRCYETWKKEPELRALIRKAKESADRRSEPK